MQPLFSKKGVSFMNGENNTNDVKITQQHSMTTNLNKIWLFCSDVKQLTIRQKVLYCLFNVFVVFCGLLVLGISSMLLAYGTSYPHSIFAGYLKNSYILFLNLFPPFVLFVFLYGIFRRIWLSYFIDGFVVFALSLSNFYPHFPEKFHDFGKFFCSFGFVVFPIFSFHSIFSIFSFSNHRI